MVSNVMILLNSPDPSSDTTSVNAFITAGGSFMVNGELKDILVKTKVHRLNNSVKH